MSRSLRSATLAISAPVAVDSCTSLLDEATKLLNFTLDTTASIEEQTNSVYTARRSANSVARLLQTKVNELKRIFGEWSSVIHRLSAKDTTEHIEREEEAFKNMMEDPDGLYATIDKVNISIQHLEAFDEDLDYIMSRLDPSRNNAPPPQNTPTIQLPKIELPIFNGDPLKWYDFWTLFETTVDQQPQLSKVQKLSYLFSCLRGQAREATRGYHLHEDSYDQVVKALSLQFGNKAALGRQLHEQLRRMRNPAHTSTDLMQYHNEVSRIVHQMEIAGIDTSSEHVIYELEDHLSTTTKTLMYPGKAQCQHFTPQKFLNILLQVATMLADIEPDAQFRSRRERGDGGDRRQNNRSSAFAGIPRFSKRQDDTRNIGRRPTLNPSSHEQSVPRTPCVFCNSMHWNEKCTQFNSPEKRQKRVTELHLCFLCLRTGHNYTNCAARKCIHCGQGHHKLLCTAKSQRPINTAQPARSAGRITQPTIPERSYNATVNPTRLNSPLKSTIPLLLWQSAPIHNPQHSKMTRMAKIFLDQGSQSSFVSERFAKELGLKWTTKDKLIISGVGPCKSRSIRSTLVTLGITLIDGSQHIFEARTLPQVTSAFLHADIRPVDVDTLDQEETKLSLPLVWEEPDILIGSNFITVINPKLIQQLRSGFALYESTIGPLIGGCGQVVSPDTALSLQHAAAVFVGSVQMSLDDLTSLDKLGINLADETIEDDERALMNFNNSVHRLPDGRYSVSWPFKPERPNLTLNYGLCYGRLQSLLRSLMSNPERLRIYHETIMQQLEDGVIEEAPSQPTGPITHYVPHQAVWNQEKKKLRVVYDASSSAPKGQALNDNLLRGPVFLPDLTGQLMRLRHAIIAIVADVEKAFLQIQLNEEDRDVARFLWVKNPHHPIGPDNPVVAYRFRRVFFGAVSSPFLLAATIRHHLRQCGPSVASNLFENTYVDNVLLTADSKDLAVTAYEQAKSVFADAKMNLREFISNDKSVNDAILPTDRYDNTVIKVLGLTWDTIPDTLTVHTLRPPNAPCTKRILLSFIAQHFDPLGLISPAILLLKLLLQDIMKNNLQWDESVSSALAYKWKHLTSEWQDLPLTVPRRTTGEQAELHIFSDASARAYATAVYLRTTSGCYLLFSKSRLCPIKGLTIPRLELLAILIGVRASNFVIKQLRMVDVKRTLWSDSKCALAWITQPSNEKLPRFVKNRLHEILQTEGITYRHVSTEDNPADLATRGMLPRDLAKASSWWNGPPWLSEKQSSWPTQNSNDLDPASFELEDEEDKSAFTQSTAVVASLQEPFTLMTVEKFGSWNRLLNVTSWALRFIRKISRNRFPWLSKISTSGPLQVSDTKTALMCLVKQAQSRQITERDISRWDLQQDEQGIWRCAGRLVTSALPRDQKYPIFIPRRSEITKLLILNSHYALLHGGVASTLAHIRKQFWIHRGRQAVRSVIHDRCNTCKRWLAAPFALPTPPPLPETRTQPSPPFSHTAVDYFGPINIRINDGMGKRWVALFTCFSTRAIHLEVVPNLTATAFIDCLRRFIARRGAPQLILSDNGTNFKLSASVLKEVRDDLFKRTIEWKFVTALAPWKGGLYERMVGIVKTAMRKTIGHRLFDEAQFVTMIIEIEGVVNQRPLTYIEADTLEVVRPIDFLAPHASLLLHTTDVDIEEEYTLGRVITRTTMLKQWARTQEHLDRFWKAWQQSYLATLRERAQFVHKGPFSQSRRPPRVGEVVLIKDVNLPRGVWKLGVITKTPIGTGDVIRSAELRTASGRIINRPISLLCPLEIDQNENQPFIDGNRSNRGEDIAVQDVHVPPRPVTRSMTKSREVKAVTSSNISLISRTAIPLLMLLTMSGLATTDKGLSVQICPYQHTGTYLSIPPIRNCTSFVEQAWSMKTVSVFRRSIVPIEAVYCSRITRTVCTWAFFRLSLKVVNDTHTVDSIPVTDCQQLSQTRKIGSDILHPTKSPSRWSTNNPVTYSYGILGTHCFHTINYVMEYGEIALSEGTAPLTDFTRSAGCRPKDEKCYTLHETIFWKYEDFTARCHYQYIGTYTAHISDDEVFIDEIQVAYTKARSNHSTVGNCSITEPIFMNNDIILSYVETSNPGNNVGMDTERSRTFLAEKPVTEPDSVNGKLQYLYDKSISQAANKWCETRNSFLRIINWISLEDTTAAARILLGRTNISAKWVGQKLLISDCHRIQPSHVFWNHEVNGKCFELLPVMVATRVVFVTPHIYDVVDKSQVSRCPWRQAPSTTQIRQDSLSLLVQEGPRVYFNATKTATISEEIVQLALDRLGRGKEMAVDSEPLDETTQWLSSTEELMSEIGHDVQVTTDEVARALQSIASRWRWIVTGTLLLLFIAAIIVVWMKCPCPIPRKEKRPEVHIELPQILVATGQTSTRDKSIFKPYSPPTHPSLFLEKQQLKHN